jgi:FkbM family methyltransferase
VRVNPIHSSRGRLVINIFRELAIKSLNKSRLTLGRLYDPLVKFKLGNTTLLIPLTHPLPALVKLYPHYSSNLGRVAHHVKSKYGDAFKVIDIGANVGDSIALLRQHSDFPVLCIEGDDRFAEILSKNAAQFSNVHLVKTFVGQEDGTFEMEFEKRGGTARLRVMDVASPEQFNDVLSVEKINTSIKKLSSVLSEYPNFLDSKMLKIDTDGFDYAVIKGSVEFIKFSKPVIFFEYSPSFLREQNEHGLSVFNLLQSLGYIKALLYDEQGRLMISIDLSNSNLLEDVCAYLSGDSKAWQYIDICAFHSEDIDLFENIRIAEQKFFE